MPLSFFARSSLNGCYIGKYFIVQFKSHQSKLKLHNKMDGADAVRCDTEGSRSVDHKW